MYPMFIIDYCSTHDPVFCFKVSTHYTSSIWILVLPLLFFMSWVCLKVLLIVVVLCLILLA